MRRLWCGIPSLALVVATAAAVASAARDSSCGSGVCLADAAPCAAAEAFVAEMPQQGMHILCAHALASVTLYVDSTSESTTLPGDLAWWQQLREAVDAWLGATKPWAIFTLSGEKVTTIEQLREAPVAFLNTGGNLVWPGVQKGLTKQVAADRKPTLET